ncbi:MAG: ABC transporter permease [Verrucomicrobiales bacterium]|nr:ABC transporter permease [Verrucomicrobiales bacterium]
MNPGITALFVRSLREEYRKPATYIVRFVVITLVLLMLMAARQQYRWGGGAPGLAVFQSVTMLNLLFIGLIGLGYFASAITEEKEDGTLGLLRMTNMSPLSILLGKSTSRLIAFLILLATQLPFVSLAVALGGVSLKQIFSCYAILGAFTFLLGNLALLFSVIFRRTSVVVTTTAGILLMLIFGVKILAAFFDELIGTDLGLRTLEQGISAISPMTGLSLVFELQFNEGVFIQPLSNVVIGLVLFLVSWAVFDIFNQGEGRGATPGASRGRKAQATTPPKAFCGKPRPGTDYAVTWREFYFQGGGVTRLWMSLLFAFILVGVVAGITGVIGAPMGVEAIGGLCITIGFILASIKWALELGTVFKHERLLQTWSALALTPKSIPRIAYEKLIASAVATLPGLLVAAFGFLLIIEHIRLDYLESEMILAVIYAFAWFLFISHTIVYLSLWLRWGAIPITIVGSFILQIFMSIMMALMGMDRSFEGAIVLWSFALVAASVVLYNLIGNRLVSLAQHE